MVVGKDDLIKARFVRFFALFMMVAAGFKVAPYVAASSVGHTLGLLDAQEPFLLKSGISRLLIVTRLSSGGRRRAVEGGAMPKLLRLVEHENEGVVDGALQALENLAGSELGLQALCEAGGEPVLQAYLQRTAKSAVNEDAVYRAYHLLADVRKWQALGANA
ncbi:hypothetical protein N2152v2_003120 [Parachlorella kessleri]